MSASMYFGGYNWRYNILYFPRHLIRFIKHTPYRIKHGFWPSDLWSLDMTITDFILPRLKMFAEDPMGYPSDLEFEEWKQILGKMVYSFELLQQDGDGETLPDDGYVKIEEGLILFAQWYRHLWT